MTRGTAPKVLTVVAVLTMIAAGVGFVLMLILNAFAFDEYDAYGEVPIPGSGTVQLPEGDVTVTFHTVLVGGSGSGLPVPPLNYRITGPGGVDATLTEDYGSTTTVNNDARVRIGYLHVATAGSYDVELDGNVSAYLNPTLAFGHGSPYDDVPWILAAVFGFGVVDLVVARFWAASVRRSGPVPGYQPPPTLGVVPTWSADQYVPSDQGIRIEQLNTLARLRESGALTEDEYEAEKRRVLDGR
ncbi:MAG: SHOCT domain-containing protein [Mycobacterium sp.]